ncbi:hypothetical protein AB4Y44_29145 [Paraburkholderia sp. BR10937]|uniref:hypothetical protein n=1 Tax=Paraburkholderia sp. BR10937 TaxID=3236994 RepID=UPI0034D20ED6
MSPQEALPIIRTLADGIDPLTGEVLSGQSPFNQPDVIRALFAAAQALGELTGNAAPREKRAAKAGTSWPPEEDHRLLESFDAGADVKELAAAHGRTTGAIKSRLVKHGRIER